MRQFYELVGVDTDNLRFFAQCHVCGAKVYDVKIPFMCRSVRSFARCAKGKAGKLRQFGYNRSKANAVQRLAIHFNQCRRCNGWVCDECYDAEASDGACKNCTHRE